MIGIELRFARGFKLLGGAFCCLATLSLSAQSTAPTQPVDAQSLARQWQDASAVYDGPRDKILAEVDRGAQSGPFRPEWGSLSHFEVPDWYKDAKFGIFIHWGVYSVPAFGSEWYPREMYRLGSEINKHHVATFGPLTQFGYKDFIPKFKAEHFDPNSWAELFQQAGAQYVVPVFEHHDGFAMYDSDLSDWTAAKMGPKRDVVGDLAKAVRARGMHLGASSHRIEHDWFMDGGREQASDVNDPRFAQFYGPAQVQVKDATRPDGDDLATDWTYMSPAYGRDWVARNAEIVQKYNPEIIFFDWWIGQADVRPYLAQFAAYYYNHTAAKGPVGIITFKHIDMQKHSGLLDLERGQLADINPDYWQTDTSVSNRSWGYIDHDTFKSPDFIVHQLVDVVSKNGNLLMNVGPRADGTIPLEVQQVLRSVGVWLKVNGEAIYGTRPWKLYGEGPTKVTPGPFHDTESRPYTADDFRFTTKAGTLYAIQLAVPTATGVTIHSLALNTPAAPHVRSVSLLGGAKAIPFHQDAAGLHFNLAQLPPPQPAYAYRIELMP